MDLLVRPIAVTVTATATATAVAVGRREGNGIEWKGERKYFDSCAESRVNIVQICKYVNLYM